jgi:hypothetical protein
VKHCSVLVQVGCAKVGLHEIDCLYAIVYGRALVPLFASSQALKGNPLSKIFIKELVKSIRFFYLIDLSLLAISVALV